MVAMPDLSNFAGMVDTLETYAHVLFLILAVYYLYLFIKGGDSRKPASKGFGLADSTKKAVVKGVKKAGKLLKKTTNLEIAEYVDLEKLMNSIEKAKADDNADLMKRGNANKAKRHESKAYARFTKFESTVASAGLDSDPTVKKSLKVMETLTKELVLKINEYDNALKLAGTPGAAFTAKKAAMKKALGEAISANRGFIAEAEKLKKVFGA